MVQALYPASEPCPILGNDDPPPEGVSYNAFMSREVDRYYQVLGVSPDADIEAVKLAYRKAALSYHPDSYKGDPAEAEQKLRALIEAYKAIARRLDPAAWSRTPSATGRTFTPQDFAREGYASTWQPAIGAARGAADGTAPKAEPDYSSGPMLGEVYATRDETRTFVIYWALAVVMGILVGSAAALYRIHYAGPEGLSPGDIALSILYGELIYVAGAAAAVVLVILTRKVVRFTLALIGERWRFLPGPRKDRNLPGASGRELPEGEKPGATPTPEDG